MQPRVPRSDVSWRQWKRFFPPPHLHVSLQFRETRSGNTAPNRHHVQGKFRYLRGKFGVIFKVLAILQRFADEHVENVSDAMRRCCFYVRTASMHEPKAVQRNPVNAVIR